MDIKALARRAREAKSWMMDACFPLWAEQGVGTDGVFLENLDMKHRPIDTELGRIRVQGRQTYVFAAAASLGWQPTRARELVALGIEILSTRCRRDDGLIARRLAAGGGLADETADLYDAAFALYSLAHGARISEDPVPVIALADDIMKTIAAKMSDPYGGFAEALPRPAYRLQNPHMHLLEASLALYDTTGEASWLNQAGDIVSLFETHFFDPRTGTLGEHFAADWLRLSGDKDAIVEPGHHFEWVWLLDQFARRHSSDLPDQAHALYRFAMSTLDGAGHPCMTVRRSGAPVDTSRRTWVQTEALKAHLTMMRHGDEAALGNAIRTFDQLFDEHLTREGGWRDHLEADGTQRGELMPASTGYHVVLALIELIDTIDALRDA